MIQFNSAGIGIPSGLRVFFSLVIAFLIVVNLNACKRNSVNAPPPERDVTWTSVDGVVMHGRLHDPLSPSPPGLILVHDAGGEASDWDSFARALQHEGFLCLAFDLRGHGESTTRNGADIQFRSFTSEDWSMAQDDLIAAKRKLLDAGADPENVFIAGAGIGGSLAVRHSVDDTDIQGVIVLSPQLTTRGVSIESAVDGNRRVPILFLATEGDTYSVASAEKLKASSDAYCESRIYRGSTQGTNLVDSTSSVTTDIIAWLDPILE